jgi:malate/lactate dehydrogenase
MGHPHRVAIVGVGHVGATTAYALLLGGLAPEIVLIDLDAQRAQGEAMDLMHAVPFSDPVRVWAGGYEDVEIIERKGATYYAVAAGVVRIIQAILRDESTVLTVASPSCWIRRWPRRNCGHCAIPPTSSKRRSGRSFRCITTTCCRARAFSQ